jgi:hypothetical protein
MRKFIPLLCFLIFCYNDTTNIVENVESSSTTSIQASTTTTTLLPSQERAKKIDIDRSPRRGIIRTSPSKYISTIYKYDSFYTNESFKPTHDFIEDFTYNINYPSFIEQVECREQINNEIMLMINNQVNYKKSVLDVITPEELEEDGFIWREILHIDYDVIEVSDHIISVLFYFYTYSSGAAHGYTEPYSLNFLIHDCSKINIKSDILDLSKEENKLRIAQEVNLQLCAPETNVDDCLGNDPFATIYDEEFFNSNGFGVFNISRNGLYFQYKPYGASSYAEGMELILLPWYQLQEVLVKNGKYASLLSSFSNLDAYEYTNFEPEWDFSGMSTLHYGLYNYYDFIEMFTYKDGRYFDRYTETVGQESGEYLYKNAWFDSPEFVYDDLIQEWCLDDGFTQNECDNTASYVWENPNIFETVQFTEYQLPCVNELNDKITQRNNKFLETAKYYGHPSPRYRGQQRLIHYVPKLFIDEPRDYLTLLEFRYDDGGGTLRYPYNTSFTINLDTCEFENIMDKYIITKEIMEELVLKYVQVGNELNASGNNIKGYSFSEDFLLGDMFFTGDTIYTVLWDCRICTDTYLILEDAPENRANPYIVAIPLFEFKLKGSY